MNLSELRQKLEDHLTDQDIQDAQELLDETCQQIVDMQAEIDALKAAQTWQPIETAPRDGTRVMVTCRKTVHAAQWPDRRAVWMVSPDWSVNPTHWMPLPPAPETTK